MRPGPSWTGYSTKFSSGVGPNMSIANHSIWEKLKRRLKKHFIWGRESGLSFPLFLYQEPVEGISDGV